MTLKIDNFHGIQPRLHPSLLADGMAVTAHNCILENGKLVPLKQPALVSGIAAYLENGLAFPKNAQSIHVWHKADGSFNFILYPGLTWMAAGNVADDNMMRIVISGETGRSFEDGNGKEWNNTPLIFLRDPDTQDRMETLTLCMNALASAPKVARENGSPELDDNVRYTRFFYTWTDRFGRESPCSPPSLIKKNDEWVDGVLEYLDGDTVRFAAVEDMPTEATALRVWKVVTGSESGNIQFVGEVVRDVASAQDGFTLTVKDENAGEIMPEIEAPPADISCIHAVPGAFYCGFSPSARRTVCFSDVDLIYSWPIAYRYDIADRIVALAVTSNSVFALTDGWPYVLSGTAPESMTVAKIAGPAACVSARSVCVYRNMVYYASHDGLMVIANDADSGTICTNVTQKIFTKAQWQAMNPDSCVVGQYRGRLFLYFRDEAGKPLPGLIINLAESVDAVTRHDESAKCCVVNDVTGKMYYIRDTGEGEGA